MATDRATLFKAWVDAKEARLRYLKEVFEKDPYNERKGKELLRLWNAVCDTWTALYRGAPMKED